MKRRGFIGAAAGSGLFLSGCDFSLRDGVLNPCVPELPAELLTASAGEGGLARH